MTIEALALQKAAHLLSSTKHDLASALVAVPDGPAVAAISTGRQFLYVSAINSWRRAVAGLRRRHGSDFQVQVQPCASKCEVVAVRQALAQYYPVPREGLASHPPGSQRQS